MLPMLFYAISNRLEEWTQRLQSCLRMAESPYMRVAMNTICVYRCFRYKGRQEKLVIRFLNRDTVYNLSTSSFSLDEIHTLRRMAANPSGVVLICGPTGSGKTTTLYSMLSELNVEGVSIATAENPVEYNMPGLAQSEVNDKSWADIC